MNLVALSIYDIKSQAYYPPFFARTDEEGLRQFDGLLRDAQSLFAKYPEDFRLFRVGEFDATTGLIIAAHEGVYLVPGCVQLVQRVSSEKVPQLQVVRKEA